MIIGNDFEAIMYIRNYQKNDLKSIIFLFRETVHSVNSKDYTQEQVKIWAPENIDEKKLAFEFVKPLYIGGYR